MGFTLRLFGIPVLSLEITGDGSAEEYYEEDRSGFGFGVS
ncbi:hypothetical protein SEA_PETRUCHIO_27 [Mycobacterium phage Petruchio]|nr:hypothetical protein SEA_PETRUCHIO_27 [Mycobacterium phage Petruchio]